MVKNVVKTSDQMWHEWKHDLNGHDVNMIQSSKIKKVNQSSKIKKVSQKLTRACKSFFWKGELLILLLLKSMIYTSEAWWTHGTNMT